MCNTENDLDQQCEAKKRKLNVIENENQNEVAVAGPSNVESTSDIFKKEIDGFKKLFEWLSVAELRTLRLTCKRLKKNVDYYISIKYPDIGKFKLNDENFDMFRQMDSSTIEWIREIDVSVTRNTDGAKFKSISKLLNKVPKISITKWKTDRDFYNCFLKHCKNLKYLSIKETKKIDSFSILMNNRWLNHHNPSIEYFSIDYIWKGDVNDCITFFDLNPNIHAISVDITCFEKILLNLARVGINFDRLYTDKWNIDEKWLYSLEQLYNSGFYKRLYLNTKCIYPEAHLELASRGTEVLKIRFLDQMIPSLPNLKELNIESHCNFNIKFENVKNIVERFSCCSIRSDDILAFIGNFPKLKHFKIECIFGTRVLNLIAMNKERQKLAGACKTIIYVENDVFSATKWATTKTIFNLIELKRIQNCEWEQFFENKCEKCEQILDQRNHVRKWNQYQHQNELVAVGPSNIESQSGIFKMNEKCFKELFEWLSLADLRAIRRTCKRFKEIVDYYIKTNYPGIGKFKLNNIKISKHLNHLHISQMDFCTIEWIREIDVSITQNIDLVLTSKNMNFLYNVEKIIIITESKFYTNFYKNLIKHCVNLKFLSINRKILSISNNNITNDRYPSVEYFHIDYICKNEINNYVKFFRLNPNIHALSIQLNSLNEIGSHFIMAGIKFDRLYIDVTDRQINENDIDSLKKLYYQDFYKHLRLNSQNIFSRYEKVHSKLASIEIEVLSIKDFNIDIPPLPSLKELNIDGHCYFDVKFVTISNVIERLNCKKIHSKDLLAIIGNFSKLYHFKIEHLDDTDKLNLIMMNKKRQKLAGACKTTIYVNEDIFLATKWASTKMNFNLIELKRIQTCDWDQFFESNCGKCRR